MIRTHLRVARVSRAATAIVAACTLTGTLRAQQTVVDTRVPGTGNGQVCCMLTPYPDPATAPNSGAFFTIGQVFQVSSPTRLSDFTFWLSPNGGFPQYQAYIAPWDAVTSRLASGTPVWSSSTYTGPNGFGTPTTFTVPGGVALQPGTSYIAFLSVVTPTGTVPQLNPGPAWNHGATGLQFQTVASGANSAWQFTSYPQDIGPYGYGSYWNAMSQESWRNLNVTTEFVAHGDLSTTTTPEPSSIALIGTGLVGLVPVMRRKR